MHWLGCCLFWQRMWGSSHVQPGRRVKHEITVQNSRGDAPHSYLPSVSNEQWDVKSQCRTFPDGWSNHYFTLRFDIISNHVLVLLLPQEGHAHRLGTSWHVGPQWQAMLPRRSPGKITSFLLYFLRIGLLHGMHVVLGREFNWLYIYIWWTVR